MTLITNSPKRPPSTLLAFGAELAADDEDRLIQAIRNGGQDTINDTGQQIVRRQLNAPPTLTNRPGFPVRVRTSMITSIRHSAG